MSYKTIKIDISGIVQGVGFRPFLYNLARKFGLKGFILNRGNAGVRVLLQGNSDDLDNFILEVKLRKPNIAFIEKMEIQEISLEKRFKTLEIKKSEDAVGISLTLPPDIAICENCLKDIRNPNLKKYYKYPFVACAVCGPRFTTVIDLPYDRERTTMKIFPFCNNAEPISCEEEYSDFNNRRFHAQTFACSKCGPNYQLYDKNRNLICNEDIDKILSNVRDLINDGKIVAIKGIGGVHLACLANDDEAVLKLRTRKGDRKYKPFAIMVPNLNMIESYFNISPKEREILQSFRRPIVLLEKNNKNFNNLISNQVAPGLNNIGIMLPYSGIHYLIFDYLGSVPLVYTSGNKSNIPMAIENDEIFKQLSHLADAFLLHDRPIYQRADDSVLRVHENKIKIIRRSRGYVPEYIPLPFNVGLSGAIAVGPELSSTGAILRRNRIFPTQHIGNVTRFETFEFLKNSIFHIKNLLKIKDNEIRFIACDKHPLFLSTSLAKELSEKYFVELYPIQHHYAHALSLMAENKVSLDEEIITLCTDGVGYGDDGKIWGGEILACNYSDYIRLGHLEYQPMIGGDRCSKYPARMFASIILNNLSVEKSLVIFEKLELKKYLQYGKQELEVIIRQYENSKNLNSDTSIPLTSSTGRIFDTISFILGAAQIRTYRGEPAMRLEGLASKARSNDVKIDVSIEKENNKQVINTSKLILDILNLRLEKVHSFENIAASFQRALAKALAKIAIEAARKRKIEKIGLTGGVAYNFMFSEVIKKEIKANDLIFLEHDLVPPGDAGISIGQIVGGIFKHDSE